MYLICRIIILVLLFGSTPTARAAPILIDSEQLYQGQSLDSETAIFLDPGKTLSLDTILQQMPSPFHEHNKDLAFGYSKANLWIRFELKNPTNKDLSLVLSIPYPMLDFIELYTVNGEVVQLIGRSGDTQTLRSRYLDSRFYSFPVTIEAHSQRYFYAVAHSTSTLNVPLKLWERSSLSASLSRDQTLLGCFFGLLIGLAFYNLFIFFATDFSRSYGWYVSFMVNLVGFYLAWTGIGTQFIWADSPFFVQKGFSFFGHVVCISIYGFQHYFLDLKKKLPSAARIYRYMVGYCALAVALICFGLPNHIAQPLIVANGGITAFITFTVATLLAIRGNRQAKFFVIAWTCFLFFIALGLSITLGLVALPISISAYGSLIGSSLECILLAIGLADRINQLQAIKNQQADKIQQQMAALEFASAELRDINENLESKVELKTREVRNLLDHIPQGVFTLEDGLLISNQYSSQLCELLGREDIAGKTFEEVFLAGASLSADQKDLILQSLASSIGTSALSFSVNSGNLPSELDYRLPSQDSKVFALTWNIDVDAENVVSRILVTVLDITKAKALEAEIKHRERQLFLVKELIECGAEKFAQFLATSGPLLAENERLIEGNHFDVDTIRTLFVNAHTAKGAARTLSLSLLSSAIHEAEDYYTSILKYSEAIDPERFRLGMIEVRRVYDAYAQTNRLTLGRRDENNIVRIDKGFLEEHCLRMLSMERLLRGTEDLEQAAAARASIGQMVQLIYKSLNQVLQDCFGHCGRIAKDLGKPTPNIQFNVIDIAIPQNVEEVLRKVFVHLMRNAMDHGIESPEDRIRKGKAPQGHIAVYTKLEERVLVVILQDDGRGLNIAKLRQLARERDSLSAEASDLAIAQTILQNGTSTASSISQVSGRGIGMDAVRRFIEEINGQIAVEFLQDQKKDNGFVAFQIKMSFPLAWDETQWFLIGESDFLGQAQKHSA